MRCPRCNVSEVDTGGRCWHCEPRQGPMPSGVQLAGLTNPEHAALLEAMKEQLLLVFLKRLGGKVEVPVWELDNTDGLNMAMGLRGRVFHFEIIASPTGADGREG